MMNKTDLEKILTEHTLWLHNEEGKRADLSEADLREVDLSGADLRMVNLRGADIRWADLSEADLRGADLSGADLRRANLRGADIRWADLSEADLRWTDLCGADIRGTDIREADLRWTDLRGADLREADLDFSVLPLWCGSLGVKVDERIIRQIVYHTLKLAQNAKMDCALKAALFTKELIEQANLFHRVESEDVERITDESLAYHTRKPGAAEEPETMDGKDLVPTEETQP